MNTQIIKICHDCEPLSVIAVMKHMRSNNSYLFLSVRQIIDWLNTDRRVCRRSVLAVKVNRTQWFVIEATQLICMYSKAMN